MEFNTNKLYILPYCTPYLCSTQATIYPWEARSDAIAQYVLRKAPKPWENTMTGKVGGALGVASEEGGAPSKGGSTIDGVLGARQYEISSHYYIM